MKTLTASKTLIPQPEDGKPAKSLRLVASRLVVSCDGNWRPYDETDIVITAILQNVEGTVRWHVEDSDGDDIFEEDAFSGDEDFMYKCNGNTLTILDVWGFTRAYSGFVITASIEGMTDTVYISCVCAGIKGDDGKSVRLFGPSEWNPQTLYYSGAEGEPYQSLVVNPEIEDFMFLCGYTHRGVTPSQSTSSATGKCTAERPWIMTQFLPFIASKVFFFKRGTIQNVNITGTITEETRVVDGGVNIINDGGEDMRSLTISLPLNGGLNSVKYPLVFLPMTNAVAFDEERVHVNMAGYREAGTRLSIYTTPVPDLANWATFYWDLTDQICRNDYNRVVAASTLVSADILCFTGDHAVNGGSLMVSRYRHGRFSVQGAVCRHILLPPGQHLHLISSIEEINGEKCLVWSVINGSDFAPCIAGFREWKHEGYIDPNDEETKYKTAVPFPSYATSLGPGQGDTPSDVFMVPRSMVISQGYRLVVKYGYDGVELFWKAKLENVQQ